MLYIQKKKNKMFVYVCGILILSLLTSCGLLDKSVDKKEPEMSMELTVLTPQSEESFYQIYGNHIMSKFPNITFKVVSSNNDSLYDSDSFFEQSHPDLVISYLPTFRDLRDQELIENLSPFVQDSNNLELDKYYNQMEKVLSNESGDLLGLAPQVVVSGIFYNKNLFDSLQIDYPTDQMDWNQILSLSSRFAKSGWFGLEGGEATPQHIIMAILSTNKVKLVDDQKKELLFNKKDWLTMIELVMNLMKQESLVEGTGEQFLEGRAAMLSSNISIIPELQKKNDFSWGVTSYPADSFNPNLNSGLQFNHVFAINKESSNKQDVWNVIAYLMSEDSVEPLQSQDLIGSISTLNSRLGNYGGIEINQLINKTIDTRRGYYDDLSQEFQDEFGEMLKSVLNSGVINAKSTEQVYQEIVSQAINIYAKEKLKSE
ncbi:ABC transporter substrate-binding protein [Paenibacillus sp. TC-CSREp1]|uniref:ABC transporter substrate-binding protein n=1 Tax=Paenibacillus sp. TC-CSREp1 TaxID=3410089 RepID=UPI003D0100E6